MAEFQHLTNSSIQFQVTGSWKWKERYRHPAPSEARQYVTHCNRCTYRTSV